MDPEKGKGNKKKEKKTKQLMQNDIVTTKHSDSINWVFYRVHKLIKEY